MTMKIGEIGCDGKPGRRDAMHVPVVMVKSKEGLNPCDNVCFVDKDCTEVQRCGLADRHAIVDPFVTFVSAGQNFWVFLIPELASNLVHHFELNVTPKKKVKVEPAYVPPPPPEPEEIEVYGECAGCYGNPTIVTIVDDYDPYEKSPDECAGCYGHQPID